MLGSWKPHAEYQQHVTAALSLVAKMSPWPVLEHRLSISKLYILNLDPLKILLEPLYSPTGRPSNQQPEIFRSLVLMNGLGYSLDKWLAKLSLNPVLQLACGFAGKLPGVASYYDLINRIVKLDEKPAVKSKKRKPKKKHGKEKMPPRNPGIVLKIVNSILKGRRLDCRPERLLQEIFAKVCVQPSIALGLVPSAASISGDGTCLATGASAYGKKICGCAEFQCGCPRRFSDPNAAWGWDSHNERWFYGYMGYFISTHNPAEKIDLPLYLRLVDAKRHDSVSAVVALAEFRDLYPNLKIDSFISDSASDNYATYKLLGRWDVSAVIALNSKGSLSCPQCAADKNGRPLCPGGNPMVNWGLCDKNKESPRRKWRCPRALGKCEAGEACSSCSDSAYGKVFYTRPDDDLRLFTKIPRDSPLFKQKMKERTAAERVNNRILHHYGIERSKARGKKRNSFFVTIAGFNIHLDAQINKLISESLFDFHALFGIPAAA